MNELIHHAPCGRDMAEEPPELHLVLANHSDIHYKVRVYEQCPECHAVVYYLGEAGIRGSRIITSFRRLCVPWIATWMHRNTLWGDQSLPGLS
jgi:hypothetical protein